MKIAENYKKILEQVTEISIKNGRDPKKITLIAVSKGHSVNEINEAYLSGCRQFGENRVPEALEKLEKAPLDISWHFIGTLQKNKVTKVIGKFHLIHSVDSLELAIKISEASLKSNITSKILLQVNTSGELSKHGLNEEEWLKQWETILSLPSIQIEGLMTMAPLTNQEKIVRECFSRLRIFRDRLISLTPQDFKLSHFFLPHLSMGMSNDYKIAIEEGATLLRIGTAIFG